jgi:hypothetical protein
MPPVEPITIRGLKDFQASLKQMDGETQKKLRVALNEAAELVADRARRKVPIGPSGAARRSVRAASQQRVARVQGGGNRAPYYPWLDFGGQPRGQVGGRARRRFIDVGRYIYPSFSAQYDEVLAALEASLVKLARDAGLEVE